MMFGASVFLKSSANKRFHWSVHRTSLDVSNEPTYSICLLIHYYDSSYIKIYALEDITKKFE